MTEQPQEECWRAIAGLEGSYEVSSLGNVRSIDRIAPNGRRQKGRLLTLTVCGAGYEYLTLQTPFGKKWTTVHRLVAQAFLPNPNGKAEVNHIDGDKTNNVVSNLEWATTRENGLHARRYLKVGIRPLIAVCIKTGVMHYFDSTSIAEQHGYNKGNIQHCLSGRRKKHGGMKWFYAEDIVGDGKRIGGPTHQVLEPHKGRSERPAHLSLVGKERGRGEEGCTGTLDDAYTRVARDYSRPVGVEPWRV